MFCIVPWLRPLGLSLLSTRYNHARRSHKETLMSALEDHLQGHNAYQISLFFSCVFIQDIQNIAS